MTYYAKDLNKNKAFWTSTLGKVFLHLSVIPYEYFIFIHLISSY